MKLVHFESGLGNQMLNYAEYLAIKDANPNDDCYMEKLIYEYHDVNNIICQWNGYELDRVFNLRIPDIKDCFTEEEWTEIVAEVGNTQFWRNGWNYPEAILPALAKHGLLFENECVPMKPHKKSKIETYIRYMKNGNPIIARIKLYIKEKKPQKYKNLRAAPDKLFMTTGRSIYVGQTLKFLFYGNCIERIEKQLKKDFTFPEMESYRNIEVSNIIKNCNSISIHARRGDDLSNQSMHYKSGYFKRAVSYIKNNVKEPVFFIFGDPGATQWCRDNLSVFALEKRDKVYFVDWNNGKDSFRDMQLMSMCVHNIFTDSTFGWWASFLNNHREKITCSSQFAYNTTHHF